jgi:hypothetical protein
LHNFLSFGTFEIISDSIISIPKQLLLVLSNSILFISQFNEDGACKVSNYNDISLSTVHFASFFLESAINNKLT